MLAAGLAACGPESPAAWRPDVVVIMLDTTRADHLGPFTDEDPTPTPFLDRLAERSIVFENAWTAGTSTAPSTASVFTGLVPPRHGVEGNLLAQTREKGADESFRSYISSLELVALPDSVPTLTEHLANAGYQTVAVGANPNFCRALGFSRGFDRFSEHEDRDADAVITELRRLSQGLLPDRPTFTYLHFMDPHSPYQRHRPWCAHEVRKECSPICRYRSEISYLDSKLGELFGEMGWLTDTIVVVVTDHGEEFGEHGQIMHRYSVHQELARAGLLITVPGVEPRRTTLAAHHTDILPTLLDVLDLDEPPTVDGIALLKVLEADPDLDRPLLTCRVGKRGEKSLWGLTKGSWRLLQDEPSGVAKLYDIEHDPLEQHDLAARRPELLAKLQEHLKRIRSALRPVPRKRVTVDLSELLREQLVQLGYTSGDDG